jgi:hypothetical protein
MKHLQNLIFALICILGFTSASFSQIIIIDVNGIIGQYNPTYSCPTMVATVVKNNDYNLNGKFSSFPITADCSNNQVSHIIISIPTSIENGCSSFELEHFCNGNIRIIRGYGCHASVIITPIDAHSSVITMGGQTFMLTKTKDAKGVGFTLTSQNPINFKVHEWVSNVIYLGDCEYTNANHLEVAMNDLDGRIQSSPNPTTAITNISFEGEKEESANITIYNNTGMILQQIHNYKIYDGKNNIDIDLGMYPSGVYNIVVQKGNSQLSKRVNKL